ncbi:MAG: phage tail protein [Deltaproteobacteria bacterium]|nr:phage tail protein [Deltaproteobacteria bacterium]
MVTPNYVVRDIEGVGVMGILAYSMVDGTYTKDGSVTPVDFATVLQELLAMQTFVPKLLYGGADYPNLKINVKLELKEMTVLEAVNRIKDIAVDINNITNRPEFHYTVEFDETDLTKWKLWLRTPVDPLNAVYIGSYGKSIGQQIRIKKNTTGFSREIDYSQIVNRVYAYGKDNLALDIISYPNGYIEDTLSQASYEIREGFFTETMAVNKEELFYIADLYLRSKKDPIVSYEIDLADFSAESSLDIDNIQLGSLVYVIDEDLGLNSEVRVVSADRTLDERGKIKLSLNSKIRNIADWLLELWKRLREAGWGVTQDTTSKQIEYWSVTADFSGAPWNQGVPIVVANLPNTATPERMTLVLKYSGILNEGKNVDYATGECQIGVRGMSAIVAGYGCFRALPEQTSLGDVLFGTIDVKSVFTGNGTYNATFNVPFIEPENITLLNCQVGLKFNWS